MPPRRPARRRPPRRTNSKIRRYTVVYDVNGPRVTLGVAWFVLELVALALGRFGVTALFSATAASAALQTAIVWRKAGARPHRVVAGAGAGAIGLMGGIATEFVGLAILFFVAGALFVAYSAAAATRRAKVKPLDDAAFTVRCGLFAGFAASGVAITARFSLTGAVGLVLIVAAYEIGDYIVGSGSSNPYEGPIAGATAIVVVTFAITAIGLKPFVFPGSFALAALAATLCPVGQLVASAILPRADAPAGALRRIDSLLLLAPIWALFVGHLA